MSETEGAVLVVCAIERHRVAVPAERVERIAEHVAASDEAGEATDLAAMLGLAVPDEERRALRVVAAGAARWLLIGSRVSVQRVSPDAFVPFPPWLEGARALQPFSGLVALDGSFALELDPKRLMAEAGT